MIFGTSGNFPTQATLFSVGSRLYAAYRGFSPPSTNAPVIAYSDDLGLNWTFGGMPVPASGANFKNWVNIGDYFYTSLLNPNNFNNRLYRFNKTNFSDKGEVSNSSLVLQSWLFVKGTRLFTLNGLNFAFTDNPLSGATDISSILPSGFAGYCMTERNIGGTLRQIIIGRRSDTGRLAIIYSNNSPTSSWTYASIPNISITSSEVGKMKVISLSKQEGFVASYIDTTDNTPSGILYSADGITWTEADAGTLTNYLNIMVNPLII